MKTLSDRRGKLAMDGERRTATVEELVTQPSPRQYSEAERSPEEEVQYVVDGWIVRYKLEHDSDAHVVLSDERNLMMIAEFPDPGCVARLSAREPSLVPGGNFWPCSQ